MPLFPGMPEVKVDLHVSHEEWDDIPGSEIITPAINRLEMGDHTGKYVDAIKHVTSPFPKRFLAHVDASIPLCRE